MSLSARDLAPAPFLRMQVCHELPAAASQAIFQEAFRLLRPGGALAVMVRRRPAAAGRTPGAAGCMGNGAEAVPLHLPTHPSSFNSL